MNKEYIIKISTLADAEPRVIWSAVELDVWVDQLEQNEIFLRKYCLASPTGGFWIKHFDCIKIISTDKTVDLSTKEIIYYREFYSQVCIEQTNRLFERIHSIHYFFFQIKYFHW